MKLNFLKLIEKKRRYLLISSARMRNTTGISISVADKTVTPSEKAKHLCVIFDRTMTTCILYHLRKIAEIRPVLTRADAENLIHTLITSRVDFATVSLLAFYHQSSKVSRMFRVLLYAFLHVPGTVITSNTFFMMSSIGCQLNRGCE